MSREFKEGEQITFSFFGQDTVIGKFISIDENGRITYETVLDSICQEGEISTAHESHLVGIETGDTPTPLSGEEN